MTRTLARLARMDGAEAAWRGGAAARTWLDRAQVAFRRQRWERGDLRRRLAPLPALDGVRVALAEQRWADAHRALCHEIVARQTAFVLVPQQRASLPARILTAFPEAARAAAARADRILDDQYDLLGYTGLEFSQPTDWHLDPVHQRRAPMQFWASVPFLDPRCGDHKIIWELNRHQHWLALGRAFWLTGDGKYRNRALTELEGWLAANPPLVGINWASMLELALRGLSWIWALHFFVDVEPASEQDGAAWTIDLLLALDRQLTHVEENLSYYFSPNTHLLGEALALYVAGRSLPELAASARREKVGRRILVAEIGRQIASDGGHCERSTHYHRYTLDFYLLALAVARVTADPIAAVFERAVGRLAAAARLIADDRGRVPHIGDDDGGMLLRVTGRDADDWQDSLAIAGALVRDRQLRIGRVPEEAFWMLSHPALASTLRDSSRSSSESPIPHPESPRSAALQETGYYISRSATGEHLVIDGGPHGYQNAGHAHADALSMTLSVRGLPLLIDPGTGCYTVDPALRDRLRSTASHNTLLLDERPQSLATGPFHWARTADAVVHRWRTTSGFDYFDGAHTGYHPMEHRRRVLALHADLVVVADLVHGAEDNGDRSHTADVHWHIGPGWHVSVRGRTATLMAEGERIGLHVPHGGLEAHVADEESGLGWHSPVYGRVEPATTLRVRHEGGPPFWIVSVFDLNPLDPVQDVEWLPVWAEAGVVTHAAAIRITRGDSTDYLVVAEPSRPAEFATWRVAEFETDARMLLCRVTRAGEVARVALVDGSIVRGAARRALRLTLGRVEPALLVDESHIRDYTPCAASPGS